MPMLLETMPPKQLDSALVENIANTKIEETVTIAHLDKQAILNYLNNGDAEEYEWEEVSAKL